MIDQLLSELRKMRSTRTNLGLLAGMIGLTLLAVVVNGFALSAAELRGHDNQHTLLRRHLWRAVCGADRRDGDHE